MLTLPISFAFVRASGRAEALEGQLLNDAIAAVREKHGATIPPDNFSGAVASKGSQQAEPVTPNLRVPYKQTTVALRNVGNVQYVRAVAKLLFRSNIKSRHRSIAFTSSAL